MALTAKIFWTALKRNVMSNQETQDQDPTIPIMMKMSGFAELNTWINLEKNSCLDVARLTRVQN